MKKQEQRNNKETVTEASWRQFVFGWGLTAGVWEAECLIVIAVNEESSTCVEDKPHCSLSTRAVFTSPDIPSWQGEDQEREHPALKL